MKSIKALANGLAALAVLPAVLLYLSVSLAAGAGRAFPFWTQAFSLIPGTTGVYLRKAFYKFVLPECGKDAYVGFGTVLSHPTARIGRQVYVGVGCMLGDVTLEADVLVGSHVSVINGSRQHGIDRLDIPVREQPGEWPHVTIGEDSWIGDRTIVMADVGKYCVVGAGSVVTKPLPDFAIAVGNPARVVRYRDARDVEQTPESPVETAIQSTT